MSTNDTEVEESQETEAQADEKLRQDLKQSLADASKAEVVETDKETNSEAAEAEAKAEATLTTEPDKDLDWYKKAYDNSTKEALRLKGELDKKVETPPPAPLPEIADGVVLTPEQLYVRTQLIKESDEAYAQIVQKYPEANNPDIREKFKQTSNQVTKVIIDTEQRFPQALELYEKTALILGLKPDDSEAVGAAVKAGAETTRTSSGTPSIPPKSKVTEAMIDLNLKMYPDKTRQEIIEELEPHIT